MLITSRETRRWVIPRGNPIRGLLPHHSAAQEAYEEAGLTGLVGRTELGSYRYRKRRLNGSSVTAAVDVFPMLVEGQSARFPERDERDRRWFSPEEAAAAVAEPGLAAIILGFAVPEDGSNMEGFKPLRSRRAKLLNWVRRQPRP